MTVCPACGMKFGDKDRKCPRCGWDMQKTGKFDCPFCGELIPIESRICPRCGVDLSTLPVNARSPPIYKIRGFLLADRKKAKSAVVKERPKRFRCPRCAALLDGTESICPDCSQFLISESGLKCPVCSTPVIKRQRKCHNCGLALASVRREALQMIPYVPETAAKPSGEPEVAPIMKTCPSCGASVQGEVTRCPSCNADLTGKKVRTKAVRVVKTQKPHVVEVPAPPQPKVELETREEPEPGTEKVTAVDLGIKESQQGFSNGLSKMTARGRTNGTGAVNGKSFVNGTGISNGLGPTQRKRATAQPGAGVRWQIIAILVVIALLIPTMVYFSYEGNKKRFDIDGNFADWSDVAVFGTRIQSTSPSSNITEWAVGSQSTDLYLYFKTQSRMMSSSEAESYYLFVDSDGSNGTGYLMESIGADYMLQLTGWNNAVDSSSLSSYSSPDHFNWNNWTHLSSLSYSTDGSRMEAMASIPTSLANTAKFVLVSKDSMERGSVSYVAPLKGPLLIVEQIPTDEVTLDGLVPKATSVEVLKIRFKSEGGNGRVEQVNPHVAGATIVAQVPSFSLGIGESKEVTIAVDTSTAAQGQQVMIEVAAANIVSSFACVEVDGFGAAAYVNSPPANIVIDGAFADWTGKLSVDQDPLPVTNPNVDIDEVGNVSTSQNSFFYVSVHGEMCEGSYVPAMIIKPSGAGGGGGGTVIPARKTSEDVLRIYVDSDRSNSTGEQVALNTKLIGADQMIEVKGLFGKITSMKEFNYSSSGDWAETNDVVQAAKDAKRIEIGITSASLEGSADVDFIVETTSWKGRSDLATYDPSTLKASMTTWVVDSLTTSRFATSMSYQRKLFFDGINYWSFFFDGKNTVCKYSIDDGQTWVISGRVFATPGVNETSIWYDSSTSTVYAIGDISLPTNNVSIQAGTVDAAAHAIKWAPSDSSFSTSAFPMAGKNTYISKDNNGYLWVLSVNLTDKGRYWMNAFKSRNVNNTDSWMDTGQMLPWYLTSDNAKGSIVPAGSGSDVWAVYIYAGYISGRKYNGTWSADQRIYTLFGSTDNTDNSPPSVVVDSKGVVHVVYGTGLRVGGGGGISTPEIMYSHNDTDRINFTAGLNLDPGLAKGVGGYYPTISLDTSTGNLYVLWLQNILSDPPTYTPTTVIGRKCVSGIWSAMTIEPQTTFTKQYMTSIYSVSGEFKICWQWTQNETSPIEVLFDGTMIPEFPVLSVPVVGFVVMIATYGRISRRREMNF